MVKRADVNRYRAALDTVSNLAKKDLADAYALMAEWPMGQRRDALADVFSALCDQYGNLAGSAAIEFYELVREQSAAPPGFRSVLAENVPDEQARKAYEYAARHFDDGNPEKVIASLNGRLQRFVEYTARETVHVNAAQVKARTYWARVPSGGECCAWCFMLASRGWVYATERSAGGVGNEFHNDDRCMIVPSFENSPELAGYDPDAMFAKYQKARDEVQEDGIRPDDKAITSRLRDMFPEDFKDGNEIPSILQDPAQGWPADLKPVNGRTWRHILKRHLSGGTAIDTFAEDMTPYDIAKVIRDTVSNPDYTKPHPEYPETVLNFLREFDGVTVSVGTKLGGDGTRKVLTAFPPSEGGGII